MQSIYEKLTGTKPLIHWDTMVRSRLNTPRHRFIRWMEVQARLQTTAKLAKIGVSASATCLLSMMRIMITCSLLVLIVADASLLLKIGLGYLLSLVTCNTS